MGQGSFENSIREKFEGKGHKAPSGVWDNIDNALNSDLVSYYESSQSWYRWLTAAAILIAVSSFAIRYVSFSSANSFPTGGTYNALLSDDLDFSQFNNTSEFDPIVFTWTPATIEKSYRKDPVNTDGKLEERDLLVALNIVSKRPNLELVNSVEQYINPYYRLIGRSSSKQLKEKSFWAGIEAGAGKFSPNFSGTNTITNSVSSSTVASAVGAGDFRNPSASATQNSMNEGVATSIGFDFGLKLGKKWTLESGLAYTNINNSSSGSIDVLDISSDARILASSPNNADIQEAPTTRERTMVVSSSLESEIDLNSTMRFASMPIKAGYFLVDNKFSLRLNAGLSANYLITNSLSDPTKQIVNSTQLHLYNDWSLDGIGGIEFGYRLFDKIDMTIEPNYRHSISPLSNSINSPSRFVVQTGFRYTLK
jgi:hypothetical protein